MRRKHAFLMLACLLVIERNVRKLGRAGFQTITGGWRAGGGIRGFFGDTGRAWASGGAGPEREAAGTRRAPEWTRRH